jgi:hypothetical protein
MKHPVLVSLAALALTSAALYASVRTRPAATPTSEAPALPAPAPSAPDARLELRELVTRGQTLAPSAKAESLAGKRVITTGYMAQMELAPKGAFYLASRPVRCDEAGAGTADLPPDALLVLTDALRDRVVPFVPGPIEVSGVLEVGNRTNAEGRTSGFRLTLDAPLGERLAQLDQPAEPQHSH